MVITCPSCEARYRLNPDKIQGRGAKITCPKCSHVFVVFTDQEGEPTADEASARVKSSSRQAAPKITSPSESAEDRRKATQTGAFKAVGIDMGDVSASKREVRIVAPGARSSRRVSALSKPAASVPTAPDAPPPAEPSVPAEEVEVNSAKDLDFRAVGIKTWKVKVAIGLIYDFSDISTLQKYLADKKVTPDDLISHNNSDWTRIGDIEDLEQHFIKVWKDAKGAIDRGDAPKPTPKRKKSEPGAAAPATTTTGSFRVADSSRASGRASGAYGSKPPRPRKPRKGEVEEEGNNKNLLTALAAIVIIGGAAVFAFRPSDAPAPALPVADAPVEALGPSEEELQKIQENIQKKIEEQQKKLEQELADPEEDLDEEGQPVERELVPVRPEDRVALQPVSKPGAVTSPTPRPKYSPPPRPQSGAVAKAPAPTLKSSGTTEEKKASDPASMYLGAGRKKLASGDYGSAKKMFMAAIGKNPKCGACYEGLAEAEKQLGNPEGAAEAQRKANQLGNTQSLARP